MKHLHRPDLRAWSSFDESRDLDFNSVAWIREQGNVLIDPMPLSEWDLGQLTELGGASQIIITNSDHVRSGAELAQHFGATLLGPAAEQEEFPIACDGWLHGGDTVVPGLDVLEMRGSKTPGELALLLEKQTLITGDLVRGQIAGKLNLLPKAKLADPRAAAESIEGLAKIESIQTVLVGDGWPIFSEGHHALTFLAAQLSYNGAAG
jgi:hypothetical protein